jgi:hypothetical protein
MKKLFVLAFMCATFCAEAKHHTILTVINQTPYPYYVWMAGAVPWESAQFQFVDAFSSVEVDIDSTEWRVLPGVSGPCTPLTGVVSIWFVVPYHLFYIEAAVDWDSLKHKAYSITVAPDYSLVGDRLK